MILKSELFIEIFFKYSILPTMSKKTRTWYDLVFLPSKEIGGSLLHKLQVFPELSHQMLCSAVS